jgi:predicted amidophosphoribosyltransferase
MRERHFPRLCSGCEAPMARQADACWRCGADWVSPDAGRPALRLIHGGASARVPEAPQVRLAAAVARAGVRARLDANR